ncbi:Zn-dependent protease with chaperone function [Bacillus mesophilus]|uniref:M48 family metalloprotease n=1 Tax=Bacillus mesophilus TaxID=1808955 RepID=A0A6M0QC01_9BACI|nr:M48 family metallopeptidase [Bacillus mesophilus]MBM7660164.1 Zn-dependent protease with chaperone function [Bacillus mesophilus]NEY73816.1 M48 family metalloprotease [Bacillus mesophilus]
MEKPLLVHKHENLMYGLCIITSITAAIYLLVSIIGAIIFIAIGLFSLFSHAISMSHIQVNGVRLKENQFPELYKRVEELSRKMELNKIPEVYIVESGGMLNAFATKVFGLFGKNMVILYSDFVEVSLDSEGHEIDYVIAHELAHIKRNHVVKALLVFPAMWIPFIGVSFSRMAEYTCDRMAAYYTEKPEDAINGLLALAAGKRLYKDVNLTEYQEQYNDKKGMFVTLTELLSTHPPIPKRIHEIQQLMYGSPSVPLITRGRQTLAIMFIVFFLFPIIVAGVTFAGIMALEQIPFLDEEYPPEVEYSPLMEATMDEDLERVSELVSAGEEINEVNEYGESPLLLAVVNEDLEMISVLIENGANPNIQDESGWTPLMSAVMTANLEVGEFLLEAGADPLLADIDEMTAIDHAAEIGDTEYVELISSYTE